jgi:GH25 family lysozyme M1 (1,4-beta-N-acetylmuramidase)
VTVYGLDVSDNNAIDLNHAFDQGYDFATARCVIGNYKDTRYPTFRDTAKARGKLFAAYVFPHTDVPWSTQAALTREWIGDPSIPIMLDVEPDPAHGARPPTLADVAALAAALRAVGLRPVSFYSYNAFESTLGAVASMGLPLVMANYGANAKGYGSALYPGDTSTRWGPYPEGPVTLLQFGSNGVIDGYAGPVDLDAYRGTLAQLAASGLFKVWSASPVTAPTAAQIAAAVHNYGYVNPANKVDMTYEARYFDLSNRLLAGDDESHGSVSQRVTALVLAVAALKTELDAVKASVVAQQSALTSAVADLDTRLTAILAAVESVQGPPGLPGPAGPQGAPGVVDLAAVETVLAGSHAEVTFAAPGSAS